MNNEKEQETAKMQLAHVLFTDIVAYSKLPTDEQARVFRTLQEVVRGTVEVERAREQDKLITLATGDGIALVFFNDPMAPVQCALEISRALYVLSREEMLSDFAYLKNDPSYGTARRDFLNNKRLALRSIEKDNSHIPDVDIRFVKSEFMAEGSTFLWFPWSLLELTRLSFDQGLNADERDAANQLRFDILNTNAEALATYTEAANLTYQFAENLYCVSEYVKAMQDGK